MIPKNILQTWVVNEKPHKIISKELKFRNGEATLSGTVYLPVAGTNLPGVVALHSASAPSRNARLYEHLHVGLPRIGIGVLLFDRRGSGASKAETSSTSDYDLLAEDALSGRDALGKLSRIDPENIGFWGLSQGGWISLLAAGRSKCRTFAIPVSAPLVTPEEQMEFAVANLLTARGYNQRDVEEMRSTRKVWFNYLKGKIPTEQASNVLRSAQKKQWFKHAFIRRAEELEASKESALKELTFDPMKIVKNLRAPTCFIYGSEDPWIPVRASLKKIRMIARRSPNINYAIVQGANHEMMFKKKELMDFNSKNLAPEAPVYFMLLTSFLIQTLRSRD